MQWPLIPTWLGCWDSHHQQQPGRYLEKEGGRHRKVFGMGGGEGGEKKRRYGFNDVRLNPKDGR